MRARRCKACRELDPHVPDLRALDMLARCLSIEVSDVAKQLAFEEGRRRVASVEGVDRVMADCVDNVRWRYGDGCVARSTRRVRCSGSGSRNDVFHATERRQSAPTPVTGAMSALDGNVVRVFARPQPIRRPV